MRKCDRGAYIFKDFWKIIRKNRVRRSSKISYELLALRRWVVRDDGHYDALCSFTSAHNLGGMASAQSSRSWKLESRQGLEDA